jgi:putative transposase
VGRRRLFQRPTRRRATCVLVLIGATEDGSKELLAVIEGYRESTQSWRELLGQLKRWVYRRRQAGHR